jgi:hypothetical protein
MQGVFINRLSSPHHWDDGGGGVHLKSAKLASPRIADVSFARIRWRSGCNNLDTALRTQTKSLTTRATYAHALKISHLLEISSNEKPQRLTHYERLWKSFLFPNEYSHLATVRWIGVLAACICRLNTKFT